MYTKFEALLKNHGVTAYKVSKETGVSRSTLSEWKTGKSVPKVENIQKIADFFDVPIGYFYGDSESSNSAYYLNEETAKKAQEIYEDPKTRILLDARRDLAPEDLDIVVALVKKLKGSD